MVATPAATSPHGCTSGANPMAYQGDMPSMPCCHLGVFLGFFGLPRRRRCRSAMANSTTPIRILAANDARDGAVFGLGGLFAVTSRVAETTMAKDKSHPKMKAAPFRTP